MQAKVLEIYFFVTFLIFFQLGLIAVPKHNLLPNSFSCLNDIYVPLDENCSGIIASEMVSVPSTPDLLVYVSQSEVPSFLYPHEGDLKDTLHGSGTWMYGLYESQPDSDGKHQLLCWGNLFSEDQSDPKFVRRTESEEAVFVQHGTFKKMVYGVWTDSLIPEETNKKGAFGEWSCWQSFNRIDDTLTFPNNRLLSFDTIGWTPTKSGQLTIITPSISNTGEVNEVDFEPIIAVYGPKGFDSTNPCANLKWIGGNSIQPIGQVSGNIHINVQAGEKYFILMASRGELKIKSRFSIYFILQDDRGNTTIPYSYSDTSKTLSIDSTEAFYELMTTDIPAVIIPNQVTLNQTEYPGMTLNNVDALWYQRGTALLGRRINPDTGFLDIGTFQPSVFLLDSMLYNYGFRPLVIENCGEWEVAITDKLEEKGDCGDAIIERTFVVRDFEEKTDFDTASIQLFFRQPNLQDIRLPPFFVHLDCSYYPQWAMSSSEPSLPVPESTGYPFISTLDGIIELGRPNSRSHYMNIGASFNDHSEVTIPHFNMFSFTREWMLYDWCRPSSSVTFQQLIAVGDWTPPVIDTTSADIEIGFSPDDCSGSLTITEVDIIENCSMVAQKIQVYQSDQTELANMFISKNGNKEIRVSNQLLTAYQSEESFVLEGLPAGEYTIRWVITDESNLSDTLVYLSYIEDNIAPTCLVDDHISVTIGDQIGLITADQVDQGSWDNCYELDYQLSKNWSSSLETNWSDYLEIECNYQEATFPIYLKVTEKRPIEEGHALSTICEVSVEVKDYRLPKCREIEQQVLFCNELQSQGDLNAEDFWNFYFQDSINLTQVLGDNYCGSIELIENVETKISLEGCGFGNIVRRYALVNNTPENVWADTCSMTLNINGYHHYQIDFPADQKGTCNKAWTADSLKFLELGCDLITTSTREEVFQAQAVECYQVYRTFSIINWCEYSPDCSIPYRIERRDWNGDGVIGDAISLLVNYKEIPSGKEALTDSSETVLWILAGPTGKSIDSLSKKEFLEIANCNGDSMNRNGMGYFSYEQIINITDSVPPTIIFDRTEYKIANYNSGIESGCPVSFQVSGIIRDACTSMAQQLSIQNIWSSPSLDVEQIKSAVDQSDYYLSDSTFTVGLELPIGIYEIVIEVRDGCGNLGYQTIRVEVYDAKGPAPICIENLVVELMPDLSGEVGIAQVFASDFLLQTPIPDCSGDTRDYRIVKLKPTQLDPLARVGSNSLILGCEDIDFSGLPIPIAVIASDSAENRDYCTSQLVLQDNLEICGYGIISGQITTGNGKAVDKVSILINDSTGMTRTSPEGVYTINQLAKGKDYLLFPQKKEVEPEGISTLDIIMVSRHLLGEKLIDNPYQLIAADVNFSNSISTLDIIWMRKMVLKQIEKFPNEATWRFIPTSWEFVDAQQPWTRHFPEESMVQKLNQDELNHDFVAIKVGDVNMSYLSEIQPRDNEPLTVTYVDRYLTKGEQYEVIFYGNRSDVNGFQFALEYSGIKIEEFVDGKVKAEHINRSLGKADQLLISWNGRQANGCLFSLIVYAEESGFLSSKIKIGQQWLDPEGYEEGEKIIPIELKAMVEEGAEILTNRVRLRSNPIQDYAIFDFFSSIPQRAKLSVMRSDGKVVYNESRLIESGEATWAIISNNFEGSGLYYYRIEMDQQSYSGKMIRLNH